jgi:hypothetical protein
MRRMRDVTLEECRHAGSCDGADIGDVQATRVEAKKTRDARSLRGGP